MTGNALQSHSEAQHDFENVHDEHDDDGHHQEHDAEDHAALLLRLLRLQQLLHALVHLDCHLCTPPHTTRILKQLQLLNGICALIKPCTPSPAQNPGTCILDMLHTTQAETLVHGPSFACR